MTNYRAWLVEINDEPNGPIYFQLAHDDDWTKDHNAAMHLSRREDAERVIQYYGWTRAKATEHMWMDSKHLSKRAKQDMDEALERNEKLADIAIDLDKQFISAAGEIASLRLALITMSMLDADSEQLKETAQRILDRSRERWPPEHTPFTSIAILEGRSIMNHKYLAPLTDGISDREAVTRADAAALVHRFEMESMALHKTQREWLVHEITALTLQDGNQP